MGKLSGPAAFFCNSCVIAGSDGSYESTGLCGNGQSDPWIQGRCLVRCRALYLNPSPFLEESERGSVIEVLVPFFGGKVVDLFYGFKTGQLHADLLCGFEGQPNVLSHQT